MSRISNQHHACFVLAEWGFAEIPLWPLLVEADAVDVTCPVKGFAAVAPWLLLVEAEAADVPCLVEGFAPVTPWLLLVEA